MSLNLHGVKKISNLLSAIFIIAALASCGGGSDGDVGGSGPTATSVKGIAAQGAPLQGAAVSLTCANKTVLAANTDAQGNFTTPAVSFTYPCVGSATKAPFGYRSVLLAGGSVNFTPLTDIFVEVMLAAATSGPTSMTVAEFLSRVQSDPTFAASVSSASNVATYRAAVVDVIRVQLIAGGKSAAEADAILASARNLNFESATFVANGTGLDKVLDDTKTVTQNPDGTVTAAVKAAAKSQGDTIAPPASGGTGGTGGTGV